MRWMALAALLAGSGSCASYTQAVRGPPEPPALLEAGVAPARPLDLKELGGPGDLGEEMREDVVRSQERLLAAERTTELVGTVSEAGALTLTVLGPEGVPATLSLTEQTALGDGERPLSWEALTEGDRVRVRYVADDTRGLVARSVELERKLPTPEPPTTAVP